jgi:hypothetical protein
VDFVLTFEEVLGMFAAKGIDSEAIPDEETVPLDAASRSGRNFAFSGGVAQAVVNAIHEKEPGREIKVAHADGLEECRKLLLMARAGKIRRVSAGGHGLPRRLRGGRGHAAAHRPLEAGGGKVRGRGGFRLLRRHEVQTVPAADRGQIKKASARISGRTFFISAARGLCSEFYKFSRSDVP